jgi:hypothetical protein
LSFSVSPYFLSLARFALHPDSAPVANPANANKQHVVNVMATSESYLVQRSTNHRQGHFSWAFYFKDKKSGFTTLIRLPSRRELA